MHNPTSFSEDGLNFNNSEEYIRFMNILRNIHNVLIAQNYKFSDQIGLDIHIMKREDDKFILLRLHFSGTPIFYYQDLNRFVHMRHVPIYTLNNKNIKRISEILEERLLVLS